MNIKKLASLLTCGFTVLGASFNSMAINENIKQPNENTNLIGDAKQQEPQLRDFTENMLEECKTKNKKIFRVPYNGKWLLVNGDLSSFRLGSEPDLSEQSFFYYSFDDNNTNLKERIQGHPIQPSHSRDYGSLF